MTALILHTCPFPNCSNLSLFVDCGPLQHPINGAVNTTGGTTVSHLAIYQCRSGFVLSGPKVRACTDMGYWSGSEPSCNIKGRLILVNVVKGIPHYIVSWIDWLDGWLDGWLTQALFLLMPQPLALCVRASITIFDACHISWTMHARVLKFHVWIPHGKIVNPICFLVWVVSLSGVMPLWKNQNEILSARYLEKYLSLKLGQLIGMMSRLPD